MDIPDNSVLSGSAVSGDRLPALDGIPDLGVETVAEFYREGPTDAIPQEGFVCHVGGHLGDRRCCGTGVRRRSLQLRQRYT